jgi:hypothetical protein
MVSTSNNTLYLFYDLEVSPVTFDFGWALALAEQQRRELSLEKIHVVFVPGSNDGLREESADYEACIDRFSRFWRQFEILHSMCNLLPTCKGMTHCATREEARLFCERNRFNIYPERYTVTFPIAHTTSHLLIRSNDAMVFTASVLARRYIQQWLAPRLGGRKLITITLRHSSYMPARNSDLTQWLTFIKTLDTDRYFPVVVPDSDSALDLKTGWEGITIFSEPSCNLQLRAALYELSYLNLGVNNGAMLLCWLNPKCRYITFKMTVPDVPQTSEDTFVKQGMAMGQSLPFATASQKWVW